MDHVAMEHVAQNAIGVAIKVTITEDGAVVNVSTVTTKQIVLKKADGTVVVKTAEFETNGSDGVIRYTTLAGDLDQDGLWAVEGAVIFPSGFNGRSEQGNFIVDRILA